MYRCLELLQRLVQERSIHSNNLLSPLGARFAAGIGDHDAPQLPTLMQLLLLTLFAGQLFQLSTCSFLFLFISLFNISLYQVNFSNAPLVLICRINFTCLCLVVLIFCTMDKSIFWSTNFTTALYQGFELLKVTISHQIPSPNLNTSWLKASICINRTGLASFLFLAFSQDKCTRDSQ